MASTARRSRGKAPWRAIAESFLPQLSNRDAKGDPLTVKICGALTQQKPRSGSEARLDMAHEVGRMVPKRMKNEGDERERERERDVVNKDCILGKWSLGETGELIPGPGTTEPLHDEPWI